MNKKKIIMLVSAVAVLVSVAVASLITESVAKIDQNTSFKMKLRKPDIVDQIFIGYNNWKYMMRNNGSYFYDSPDLDHNANNTGGEFPRGSNRTIVYAAGLYIATVKTTGTGVDTQVVSNTEFSTEFRPGFITNSNVPFRQLTRDDHLAASNKVYVIYKDPSLEGTQGDVATWPGDHQTGGAPALIGNAVTWAVFNDVDTTLSSEGIAVSPLPGLGVQVELQSIAIDEGALSDVVFIRMKIINKTNTNYPKSFVGLWMDADVNDSSNDIVGVDTIAGLGYVYDSENETNPAATGFDFFQGPVVDVGTISPALAARFAGNNTVLVYNPASNDFTVTTLPVNKIWLGATSFNTYANGTDPTNNKERYYLLEGKNKTTGVPKTGTGVDYKYAFPGNPLTAKTGDLNVATDANKADQRILHGVGPFVILANDSIEMWAGVVGGEGANRLGAFAVMKTTDAYAQTIFNAGLTYPTAPNVPAITVTPLDGQVSITWDNRVEYSTIDIFGQKAGLDTAHGYTADYLKNDFQGYRVYRSLTGLPGTFTRLAEFDKADGLVSATNVLVDQNGYTAVQEVVYGTDNGLQYSYIDHDVVNGTAYFYAVVAYDAQPYIGIVGSPVGMPGGGFAAGPIGMPISLESSLSANLIKVVPKAALAGSVYDASISSVTHTGPSDGTLDISILDPSLVRNGTYKVEFFTVPDDSQGHALESDTGTVLAPFIAYRFKLNNVIIPISSRSDDPATFYDFNGNGTYQAGVDIALDESKFGTVQASTADAISQIPMLVDGMAVTVYGPALAFKAFNVTANASGPLNPVAAGAATAAFNSMGFPSDDPDLVNDQQVNGSFWFMNAATGVATSDGTIAAYIANAVEGWNQRGWNALVPYDFEVRFVATAQTVQLHGTATQRTNFPFEAWNVTTGTKLLITTLDDNASGDFDLRNVDHPISGGTNDPFTDRYYIWDPHNMSAGTAGYDAWVALNDVIAYPTYERTLGRQIFISWNGGETTTSGPYISQRPETGTIFRINTTKPNSVTDVFTFTGTANTASTAKADVKSGMKNIKVVPNPYYGRSAYQVSLFDKQIKFTHLPDVCTIKIFTVSGDLVTTLTHNDASTNDRSNNNPLDLNFNGAPGFTSTEVWNLQNTGGKYVASGMYIALVEAPGKGKQLVKFAVIQEEIAINGPDVR